MFDDCVGLASVSVGSVGLGVTVAGADVVHEVSKEISTNAIAATIVCFDRERMITGMVLSGSKRPNVVLPAYQANV